MSVPAICRLSLHGVTALCLLLAASREARAVSLGQVDTFSGGTPLGWQEGPSSTNPPVVISTGGPAGIGDAFLQNLATGGVGAGSRMTMFNTSQWRGDYLSEGITALAADAINLGTEPLHLRIAVQAGTEIWVSRDAWDLSPGAPWQPVHFDLAQSSLRLVTPGPAPVEIAGMPPAAFSNVTQLRMISSLDGLSESGDLVFGTLGVDNIRAVPEPASTTVWLAGLVMLAKCRRRRIR